jgi:two-component system nitrogen regulation sensor histidine kinase GlnL
MGRDFRQVLDAVLAGVVVVDPQGLVELVNVAACRMLEVSPEAALGRPVERLLGPDHALTKLARTVLDTGRTAVESDQPVERRLEPDLVIDVSASPLFDAGGELDGAVVMLRDRTIQNRLQELVEDRERLAGIGHLAAGLAHEVKNPLGGIRGAGEILRSRAPDARTREAADLVVREVDRITGLVDELMVFGKGEALRLAPTNLHRVLDGALELLALDPLARGVGFERVYDPSIPELLADADRLSQVFLNLGRNALQAMRGREDAALSAETRIGIERRLVTPEGDRVPTVVVTFRDRGEGIAPEALARIATPFFTTRPGGHGLGLGIARHWVAQHGGALRLVSTPGEGTEAEVTLPLRRPR